MHKTLRIVLVLVICVPLGCFAQKRDSIAEDEYSNAQYTYRFIQALPKVEKELTFWSKIRFGGFAMGSFQYGGQYANFNVGAPNTANDEYVNRMGIRTARLRSVFSDKYFLVWLQFELSEKSFNAKDVFIRFNDPWLKSFSLDFGLSNIPFTKETTIPVFHIEADSKALAFTSFIPNDRDVGAKLTYNLPSKYWFDYLQLNAAVIAGNGVYADVDNRKNTTFKIEGAKSFGDFAVELSTSYYNGFVYQPTERVYRMEGDAFRNDSTAANLGAYADKWAFDVMGQVSYFSPLGETSLRGEYLVGQQPGTLMSNKSQVYSRLPVDLPLNDTYIRPFNGGVVYLIHRTRNEKHAMAVRYDWYNPNTAVAGDRIGMAGTHTSKADITYRGWSFSYFYYIHKNFRLSAHYELIDNERSCHLEGFSVDRNDNLFTTKVQVMY